MVQSLEVEWWFHSLYCLFLVVGSPNDQLLTLRMLEDPYFHTLSETLTVEQLLYITKKKQRDNKRKIKWSIVKKGKNKMSQEKQKKRLMRRYYMSSKLAADWKAYCFCLENIFCQSLPEKLHCMTLNCPSCSWCRIPSQTSFSHPPTKWAIRQHCLQSHSII